MASESDENKNSSNPEKCYREWMDLQEKEHSELVQALNNEHNNNNEVRLRQLVEKATKHFEAYTGKRAGLARSHASSYFAPTWCSSLEASMLWAAGCRPTSFIRLLYMLCGQEAESQLLQAQGLAAAAGGNALGDLSSLQLKMINELHMETIKQEDRLSSRLASLQEDVADHPLAIIAKELRSHEETSREAEKALDEIAESLRNALEEGDRLRMGTLKQLINILTPIQALEFLVASKKLHLCIHSWGTTRDHLHARNN